LTTSYKKTVVHVKLKLSILKFIFWRSSFAPSTMAPILDVPPGVVTGENMLKLLDHARSNGYAIPAVNCSSSSTANAVLEAAKKTNSPIIIQVSQGGGQFIGGKGLAEDKAYSVSAAGSVALAMHVRSVAPYCEYLQ
jgi:fructose-bisphosphate aldolase class II